MLRRIDLIVLALGCGVFSQASLAGSDAEKLIQQEHNQTAVLLQKIQESQAKQFKDLNTKIQLQLKQVKEDSDAALKTVNDQNQKLINQVKTDLMTQLKQVQSDCAKACAKPNA